MKSLLFPTLVCFNIFIIACQPGIKVEVNNESKSRDAEMSYDSALAQKLGADEYGMKRYVMA